MKKCLSFLLVCALLIGVASPALAADAAVDNISRDDVILIVKTLGIMEGYGDGSFGYDNKLTRAQFAKVAVMASPYKDMAGNTSRTSPFSDVKSTHWSASYVAVAAKNGLLKGYSDGMFRPNQNVRFEEAVTVCLRLLGYKDEELTGGYPDGQLSMARNIGLTDQVSGTRGQSLTRGATSRLIYNLLASKPKASAQTPTTAATYYQLLGYTLTGTALTADAVVLANLSGPVAIVTADQEKTLGLDLGKVTVYKDGKSSSLSNIQIGDVVYYHKRANLLWVYGEKVTGTLTAISPSAQSPTAVVVDGVTYTLSTADAKKVFGTNGLSVGQVVTLTLDKDGAVGYALLAFSGPFTYRSPSDLTSRGLNASTAIVYRNDVKVPASDLSAYDVLYFNAGLNTVWAYDKKVTGRPESIVPNRMSPLTVVMGEKSYTLSNSAVKQKFGMGGFDAGTLVTLLLDYSGQVFDAYPAKEVYPQTQGVIIEQGAKQFSDADGKTSVSYYGTVLLMSGDTLQLPTTFSLKGYVNRAVKITLTGNTPIVSLVAAGSQPSGHFDWVAGKMGSETLSRSMRVLEVDDYGNYGMVSPERLDEVSIARDGVLLASKNESGAIAYLILKDVTNDLYSYGIVTSIEKLKTTTFLTPTVYYYEVGGKQDKVNFDDTLKDADGGPARFAFNKAKIVEDIKNLTAVNNAVDTITPLNLVAKDGKSYKLSPKVVIYKQMGFDYLLTSLDEAIKSRNVSAYMDREMSKGGLVRMLIIR